MVFAGDGDEQEQPTQRFAPVNMPEIEPDEGREEALLARTRESYPDRNSGRTRVGSVPAPRKKSKQRDSDRVDLFIGGPKTVMEAFITFKEHEGYVAYWDALQDLMQRAGVFDEMVAMSAKSDRRRR